MRLFFTDGERVLSIETRREWYYFEDKRQNKNTPIIRISPEDLENIDPKYTTLGSIAIVLKGSAGLEVYMAASDK